MVKKQRFYELVNTLTIERESKKEFLTSSITLKYLPDFVTKACLLTLSELGVRLLYSFEKIVKQGAIKSLPKVCVLSLSSEQLLNGESNTDLESFFREDRFGNMDGEILIETKLSKSFKRKPSSHKLSIPIHFFLHRMTYTQKIEVLNLFSQGLESYYLCQNRITKTNLKTIYTIFELAVWFVIRDAEITIITTQSTMGSLPVAFRISDSSFVRKMFWYSTNSQSIARKDSPKDKPNFSKDLGRNVDEHYVWDLDSRRYLELNEISKVTVVGSILFVKPKSVELEIGGLNLAYFDVTPIENPDTYYTVERMCTNLSKLVEVVCQLNLETQLKVNLLVKPKREISKSHSRRYVKLLNHFEKQGNLKVIRPETNLYGFISKVDCVIGIPFTSPVVVGRELGVASGYIDFYKDDFLIPETHNGFPVILEELHFMSWLKERLQELTESRS